MVGQIAAKLAGGDLNLAIEIADNCIVKLFSTVEPAVGLQTLYRSSTP